MCNGKGSLCLNEDQCWSIRCCGQTRGYLGGYCDGPGRLVRVLGGVLVSYRLCKTHGFKPFKEIIFPISGLSVGASDGDLKPSLLTKDSQVWDITLLFWATS